MINEREIVKTFDTFKVNNGLVEVRVISGKQNWSGYFKDVDNLIESLKPFDKDKNANIYFVFNAIDEACYSKMQKEQFVQNAQTTTTDKDIIGRDWLLVDIDPTRTSGVSSSDDEKENAHKVAISVYKYLKQVGFTAPVVCDSGNGYHLMYKIGIKNDEEGRELVKNVLSVLDMLFSNETASVDISVFNAARITKLYGTTAKKGSNTKERPHRESKIISIPENIERTDKLLLKKVADLLPKQNKNKSTYISSYNSDFDIEDFLNKHNISIERKVQFSGGTKYVLSECVFDPNHKAPDACIFVMNNGAISYKCFHNSCQQYTWQDVRKKFEPNCYERRYNREYNENKKDNYEPKQIKSKNSVQDDSAFFAFEDVKPKDRSQIVTIKSGFTELDNKIGGFNKGEISLWSGRNASNKSGALSQICLNAVNQGYNCAIFSGELPANRLKNWMLLQAAGRQNVVKSQYYENSYFVNKENIEKINSWISGHMYIYNNDNGNDFKGLLKSLGDLCDKKKIDVVVLDNLMALDILTLPGDKYEKQTNMILELSNFVKEKDIHLHIVCHPRKSTTFLRKEDISGTADLTNAVDNVLIVHRVGQDFARAGKEFYGKRIEEYTSYGNVIEICKNRDMGAVDELIGMYFEIPSKRMLNEPFENVVYSWETSPMEVWKQNLIEIEDAYSPFKEEDNGKLPY